VASIEGGQSGYSGTVELAITVHSAASASPSPAIPDARHRQPRHPAGHARMAPGGAGVPGGGPGADLPPHFGRGRTTDRRPGSADLPPGTRQYPRSTRRGLSSSAARQCHTGQALARS